MSISINFENKKTQPVAKTVQIVIQEFGDELLVYDLETNQAHCLNLTAKLVWRACTGDQTPERIAKNLSDSLKQEISVETVWLALTQLNERKLINGVKDASLGGVSRRGLIKKLGLASAAALPLISSLSVPTNVLAQSSICGAPVSCTCNGRGSNGGSCASANCISGCTCRDLTGCNPGGNQCRGTCQA